jgi:rod shape-determining protein MreD
VIRSREAALRVGLLVLAAVVLQISVVAQVPLLGGTADLIPLVVAALALYGGSVAGALAGFSAGLVLDVALGMNLGGSSLVLTGLGYAVGRLSEQRDVSHGLLPIAVAAAASAGYDLAYGAITFMLDLEASVSALVLRDIVVGMLLNAAIALPFFALVRRVVRPVLSEDRVAARRRRARPREAGPIGLRGLEVHGRTGVPR